MVATSQRPELMALHEHWADAWEEALAQWRVLCADDGSHELALRLIADDAHATMLASIKHIPRPETGR